MLTYGRLSAVAVDPIEKKPLSHFLPGTRTFSVGTDGCNLMCPFCQNASLSQCPLSSGYDATVVRQWSPDEVVQVARHHGCDSIAFTYSEPTLATEFALEVAPLAKSKGVRIVYVTNGQVAQKPLEQLCLNLSAANVDLKSFSESVYRTTLKGELGATLNAIEKLVDAGVWVEITTLIVPEMNDSTQELTQIARFIAGVSKDIPWHVSRFHPAFKRMDVPATDTQTIFRAMDIGSSAGLQYIYAGNMPMRQGEDTCCPSCKHVVVARSGFRVIRMETRQSKCPKCGQHIAGVGFP